MRDPASGGGATRCVAHREQCMVYAERLCEGDARGACTRKPSYAPSRGGGGGPAVRCSRHRRPDDVDTRSTRCTAAPGCTRPATMGVPHPVTGRLQRQACRAHATPSMRVSAGHKCGCCGMFIVRRGGDLCWTCRRGSERHARVEHEIRDTLCAAGPPLALFSARDTPHPCTRALGMRAIRPDFAWELPQWAVILEVDEHEHRLYEPRCEQARIHELHELVGKPLVLVRYNPHGATGAQAAAPPEQRHAGLQALLHACLGTPPPTSAADADALYGGAAARATGGVAPPALVRGSETLRVVYAGYTCARVDALWDEVRRAYASSHVVGGGGGSSSSSGSAAVLQKCGVTPRPLRAARRDARTCKPSTLD